MNKTGILGAALALTIAGLTGVASQSRPDYPFQPVPFTSVHLTDVFWAPRIETNRTTTIPVAFRQCERTNRVYHFERAARALRGEPLEDMRPPGYPFDDTDLYKVIEGASYTLNVHPDPKLDAYVDGLIVKIALAVGKLRGTRGIRPGTALVEEELRERQIVFLAGDTIQTDERHFRELVPGPGRPLAGAAYGRTSRAVRCT